MGKWETLEESNRLLTEHKREMNQKWYATHIDEVKAYHKNWRAANSDRVREGGRQWRENNSVRYRSNLKRWRLANRYNLTEAGYEALYIEQQGLCAICQCPPKQGKILEIDHDHVTLTNRALLCNSCNVTIGASKENIDILKAAIGYLEKWRNDG